MPPPIPWPFPADKLVSADNLQIGKYYYFTFNQEFPIVFSGRYVSKAPVPNHPETQNLKWDNVLQYQMVARGVDDWLVGQPYRRLERGHNTFIPYEGITYIPAVERELKSQARDLASGEVSGILRHRDQTQGLAPEGSALDRAMATGILPSQVGKFLTNDPNIHRGSEGSVKKSLRNIGDKLRAGKRRRRKTRRSRK
jgi:hypothetical protein